MSQKKVNGTHVPVISESDLGDSLEPTLAELAELEQEVEKVEKELDLEKESRRRRILTNDERYMIPFNESTILSHEEVIALSKIKNRMTPEGLMTPEGREAHDRLVLSNLRFVRVCAYEFTDKGVPLEDLCQEGVTGLIRAVERYDYTRSKLSTYAYWWIRQKLRVALTNQSREIRIPVHAYETLFRVRRIATLLEDKLKRRPTVREIADECKIEPKEIERIVSGIGRVVCSIHDPIKHSDDDQSLLGDLMPDDTVKDPFQVAEAMDALAHWGEKIGTLPVVIRTMGFKAWNIQAFELFYGLNGIHHGEYRTLESVALVFGKTIERVRQVITRMCYKLGKQDPEWLQILRALEIRGEKRKSEARFNLKHQAVITLTAVQKKRQKRQDYRQGKYD